MTFPRCILPGTTYLFSRRTTQRQFLLRPSPTVNHIFLYCLAWAANITNIKIHSFVVLSNHWHCVLTDPDGRLPEFAEYLHKYTAKCLNIHFKRWENLWSSDRYSAVPLPGRMDVLDKIAYTLVNPVSAGLVSRSRYWPGLRSTPEHYTSQPIFVKRPSIYFRSNGKAPEREWLELTVPPVFAGISKNNFANLVAREVQKREENIQQKMAREGRKVLGKKNILAQCPTDTPYKKARHGNLNPRVAGKNKWRRLEAVRRLKSFINSYREARKEFSTGKRDVLFPPGTYWLCRFAGAACGGQAGAAQAAPI